MKFIHTADWHLGKLFYGEYLTEEQEWLLKNQFLPLVDEEKPDVILLAGDVYDRSVPPAEAVELFDEMISEITGKRKIPFIVISGNHDSAERLSFASRILRGTGLFLCGDLYHTLAPVILKDDDGEVAFAPLPYAEPGKVREALSADVHTHEEAERVLSDFLLRQMGHAARKIAIAHEFVAGLGHLHGPQQAGGKENVRYSGSLLKYSFSEAAQKKGVIVGEIDGAGQVKTTFISLSARHDVRVIKGFFDDLIKGESEDFLMAELLDEGPVIDAMARLRQKYPRMMTIQSHRRMNSGSGERSFDLMKKVDPLDMFRVFYKEFQDKEFTEEEEDYMKELWEDLRKEDD